MNWLITAGGYAAAVSAIIGAIVLVFWRPFKAAKKALTDAQKASQEADQKILTAISNINLRLDTLSDDIVYLQRDRLQQHHDTYMSQGWIDPAKKRELSDWYESYCQKGYNHLSQHYMEDLERLPEHPNIGGNNNAEQI